MKRFTFALTIVGALLVVSPRMTMAHGPNHDGRGRRGDHARFHDDLRHRKFHRRLRHREAHRYPMSRWEHRRLHGQLRHETFHDRLEHRAYHRDRFYVPFSGSRFGNGNQWYGSGGYNYYGGGYSPRYGGY